jgi:hypothetical protein
MRVKRWIIVGLIVALAGCASPPKTLDRELRAYVGLNITAVSGVLGSPESEDEMSGDKLYTWQVDNRFTVTLPAFNLAIGDIDGNRVFMAGQGAEDVHLHYQCNLQVVTNQDGIIRTFHSRGNEGCQRFVRALDM